MEIILLIGCPCEGVVEQIGARFNNAFFGCTIAHYSSMSLTDSQYEVVQIGIHLLASVDLLYNWLIPNRYHRYTFYQVMYQLL